MSDLSNDIVKKIAFEFRDRGWLKDHVGEEFTKKILEDLSGIVDQMLVRKILDLLDLRVKP